MGGSLSAHSLSAHLSILLQSDFLFSLHSLTISTGMFNTPFITSTLEMKHLTTTKVLSAQELSALSLYFFEFHDSSLMNLLAIKLFSAHLSVLKLFFCHLMWVLLCDSFPQNKVLLNHAVRGAPDILSLETLTWFFFQCRVIYTLSIGMVYPTCILLGHLKIQW